MIRRGVASLSLAALARALGREQGGAEGELMLHGAANLERAGADQLSALYDSRELPRAAASGAGVLIVQRGLESGLPGRRLIVSPAAKADFARAIELLHPPRRPPAGVHPSAVIAGDARLEPGVSVGPLASVGSGCRIGGGTMIGAGAVLLEDVEVGDHCEIHPRAVLYPGTRLGAECLVLAGAVVGAPGFGQAHDEAGRALRMPHLGRVVVESGAEIGANATVDRASFGETRIGARARLDNLVQIGHNAEVGEDAMIAAQSGLSGSSRLGRGVRVGGQSGLADHVQVADGSAVAAKTAVFGDVGPGVVVAGIPAQPLPRWRRMVTVQARLPEIWSRLRRLLEREED